MERVSWLFLISSDEILLHVNYVTDVFVVGMTNGEIRFRVVANLQMIRSIQLHFHMLLLSGRA